MKYFSVALQKIVGFEETMDYVTMTNDQRKEWFETNKDRLHKIAIEVIYAQYKHGVKTIEDDSIFVPEDFQRNFLPIYNGKFKII